MIAELETVALEAYLKTEKDDHACSQLANGLEKYGAALVVDPRTRTEDASAFRSLMERYFAQPRDAKLADARPELHYQVGCTPDHVELPRLNTSFVEGLASSEKPQSFASVSARQKDPKWRFFWRIGDRPAAHETNFPSLNAPQVVPKAFESEWASTLDDFGGRMLRTVETVAEMLAIGLGLPAHTFRDKMLRGPHLLAPTGADLSLPELGETLGATLAGYHYDLNFITIHAPASYPGLYIWTAQGKRLAVKCPPGTLLIQAGSQLEYLTANKISRGFHEVVVTEQTIAAAASSRRDGRSMWRVSSTMFTHIRSDESLAPVGKFSSSPLASQYDTLAGAQVADELRQIALTN